jgi:predicted aspartyl protease
MDARRAVVVSAGVLLGSILGLAAAEPARGARGSGYAQVQMTRGPQNHLLVPVQVNGHSAIFLLDTAAVSFIRADRARSFGISPQGSEIRARGRSFPLGTVNELTIGSTAIGATTVALADASQFRGTAPGRRAVDGILGLDVLRRHKAVINCHTGQLFLATTRGARLDLSGTTAALGFTKIPLDRTRRGGITAPCLVHGRRGKLLVDTGAFVTGFDDDGLRGRGIAMRASALTTRGIEGDVRPVQLADISDLRIGGIRIAPQTFAVIDLYGKKKPVRTVTGIGQVEYYRPFPAEQRIIGVLGNELLDQHRAIIDFSTETLFMK